jgi:hypothetical protein
MSEQEYRYRVRSIADNISSRTDVNDREWLIQDETENSDILYKDKYLSPIHHHHDEPSSIRFNTRGNLFIGVASALLKADVRKELEMRKDGGENRDGTCVPLEELLDEVIKDHPDTDKVYVEYLPSSEEVEHILIKHESPEGEVFCGKYPSDLVALPNSKKVPFCVKGTTSLPEEDSVALVYERALTRRVSGG